jgi:HAE1 family hydrophobic/amphiphilic exporter-1
MNLGALSVRRGVTTAMLYLAAVGFGAYSLYNLPVNRLPEVELPVIAVVTTYQGAAPEDIEALVTRPIERAVSSVGGIEKVQSTSRQGASIVIISFTWGTDMEAAEIEVRKNLELFSGDFLPDEATKPITFAFDPSLAPVMFLSVDGDLDGYRLRRIASERIQPYLGRVDGVAAAELLGGLDREIQVRLNPRWLEANGISPNQVVDGLRAANVIVPSGAVDDGTQLLNLQPTGLYRSVREIERSVIAVRGGRPVLLSEVAEVADTFEEETAVVTVNGKSAVIVAVRKQSDANTVQVSRAVADALPEINRSLPEGVELVPLFDQSDSILRAISNLGTTALQAFALTGLVILIFLRSWRTSLVAIVAVPVSVLVSFVVMDALGVTLNLISVAGLALAVGMIVDNGIVVLECAFQKLEQGRSAVEAAIEATTEMGLPVTASTLTTVVVFVPILLVEGIAGELFRDLVITVTVTLLVSLVVAITLVPLMIAWVGGKDDETPFARFVRRLTGFVDRLAPAYDRGLRWSLANRKKVYVFSALTFVASLAALPFLGRDFLPKTDNSELRIEVTGPPGASLDEMRTIFDDAQAAVRETVPEALIVSADFGQPEGFSAIFGATANTGNVRVKLPPPRERSRSQQEIEAALTERFAEIPGVELEIAAFSLTGGAGDVEVKLFGDDFDELREYGERLRDELAGVEGVREVRFSMASGAPELQVTLDRERLRTLGLTPAQVTGAMATYYAGVTATVYRDDGTEFAVRVRGERSTRRDLDALRYLPIDLPAGGTVPLGSIASIDDRLGPIDVEHENQQRLATVSVIAAETDLGSLTERVEARIADVGIPESIRTEIGGTADDLRDAFFKLAMALLAALALVYMVMASQFESLLEPFVIMLAVPLEAIGVVAALVLTGTTLQVTALVGVILLGGVVVNNGIVLVDVLKRRRREGRDLTEATLEAGRTRLRPILMTALTTIVGMLPLAFGLGDGAEIWAPMARTVVGGLTVSTFLTLFAIPLAYVDLATWVDRRRHDRMLRREAKARANEPRIAPEDEPVDEAKAARESLPQEAIGK